MIALTQHNRAHAIHRLNNRPDLYGTLVTPRGNRAQIPQTTCVIGVDNGAFSRAGFEPATFLRLLEWLRPHIRRVKFVAAPDVVEDWPATLALFTIWQTQIRRVAPYPVAIVLQDGAMPATIPWAYCQSVFVGGSTGFKLSAQADECIAEAKRLGKWVHVGRLSTRTRLNHFRDLGLVDSFDSSAFARWPRQLDNVMRWLRQGRFEFPLPEVRR